MNKRKYYLRNTHETIKHVNAISHFLLKKLQLNIWFKSATAIIACLFLNKSGRLDDQSGWITVFLDKSLTGQSSWHHLERVIRRNACGNVTALFTLGWSHLPGGERQRKVSFGKSLRYSGDVSVKLRPIISHVWHHAVLIYSICPPWCIF